MSISAPLDEILFLCRFEDVYEKNERVDQMLTLATIKNS
jgi:hypothetical protein